MVVKDDNKGTSDDLFRTNGAKVWTNGAKFETHGDKSSYKRKVLNGLFEIVLELIVNTRFAIVNTSINIIESF